MSVRRAAACLLAATLAPPAGGPALAGTWDVTAEVGTEARWYPQDAEGTSDGTLLSLSLTFEPEAVHEWNDGKDRLTGKPFLRLDSDDRRRSHWDVRAASWLHQGDGFDLLAGVDKVFWGKTESVHLVDIVNQTDAVENVDGEDKLGQPMVNLGLYRDWGTLNLFVLPYFRERPFHSDRKRLSGATPILAREATYGSGLEEWHPDVALRYSRAVGDVDLGVSHFHGTSREPGMVLTPLGFVPHYDQIDQTGLDAQYTTGAWLWKLEAMTRGGQGSRFAAAVGGFEYTAYGVFDSAADVGLLLEGQYDGRGLRAPATAADHDLFAGLRLTLNDTQDTNALLGAVHDLRTGTMGISLEAKRRLWSAFEARLEGRFFLNPAPTDPSRGVERDDHVVLRLAWFY